MVASEGLRIVRSEARNAPMDGLKYGFGDETSASRRGPLRLKYGFCRAVQPILL
jgi:hypothetical protein